MPKTNLPILALGAPPIGSLDAYIGWVQHMPMLSAAEEKALAERLQRDGDVEAARRLVLSHLRFVVSTARSYLGYGLPLGDLIQEGNVGLMKAVKRFDPTVGVRLVSFAVHWIKAEIHEYVLRNWRIVKVATTKAQRKLFFNLRKATKELTWFNSAEVRNLANDLNVSEKEVRTMEARMTQADTAFDRLAPDSDDSAQFAPADYLEDHRYNPEQQIEQQDWSEQREQHLRVALTQLDERSRDILNQRWLAEQKVTLHELATKYNVSAERIRQLEKAAMEKLKAAMAG